MTKYLAFIFVTSLFIFACTSDSSDIETNIDSNSVHIDDPNSEFTAADTSSTGVYQEEVDDSKEMTLQEAMKAANASPKVEEGGMSFCDCVKKQKQLEKTMLETEDDAEFDKAMAEMEKMKSGECKILFEGNQSTLEAKQAHEKKVKNCL